MSELTCIIHYKHLNTAKDTITAVSEDTIKRLLESRDARYDLGSDYIHREQIDRIPEHFDGTKHGYHRQCYQKFTNAISVLKRKSSLSVIPEKRQRRSGDFSKILFPDYCMKCKSSNPITVKGKKHIPKNLTTITACEAIKRAARLHNDDEMRMAVDGEDLIAREFKMHEKCYKDFTRICSKETEMGDRKSCQDESNDSKERLTRLFQFVKDHVIEGEQAISIKLLTEIYGLDEEDCRLRGKVKQMLLKEFKEELLFVTVSINEAQVVISKNVLTATTKNSFLRVNKKYVIKEAAEAIRDDIQSHIQSAPDLPWPPTVEALQSKERQGPESLTNFLLRVIKKSDHNPSEDVKRYAESIAQDVVHAYTKGKFLTCKHILLGCGLHSITGMKKPIEILAKCGHSCNYNMVQEIETAQAELAQQMISRGYPLPLIPSEIGNKVQTIFWWDNFDCKKESKEGSIHTCHGVAFQEESSQSTEREDVAEVPRSKKRTVSVVPIDLSRRKVIPHKEPKSFNDMICSDYNDKNPNRIILEITETSVQLQ